MVYARLFYRLIGLIDIGLLNETQKKNFKIKVKNLKENIKG
jgi:hypothetical protein